MFVATWSNSQDFVAPDGSIPGYNNSAGVVRLNASGTELVYATFLGGWHSQLLYRALATNAAGEVVIGGETYSPDFPTTAGAFDRTRAGDSSDGFVAKLGPLGQLIFSTFLGGANPDNVAAVAVRARRIDHRWRLHDGLGLSDDAWRVRPDVQRAERLE